jgi:FMN reductase
VEAVLISGSPNAASKSRTLLEHARARLEAADCATTFVDLTTIPADALLGRRTNDGGVTGALAAISAAQVVIASSPTYRATYSGLLKAFFDLLPQDALAGKIGVPILTGGGSWHQLALDHSFRPLFASVGATTVNGVYGYDAQFKNGPDKTLLVQVDAAVDEALRIAKSSPYPVGRGARDEVNTKTRGARA